MNNKLIKLAFKAGYKSALSSFSEKSAGFFDNLDPDNRKDAYKSIAIMAGTGGVGGAGLGAGIGGLIGRHKKDKWYKFVNKKKRARRYAGIGALLGGLAGATSYGTIAFSDAKKLDNMIDAIKGIDWSGIAQRAGGQ